MFDVNVTCKIERVSKGNQRRIQLTHQKATRARIKSNYCLFIISVIGLTNHTACYFSFLIAKIFKLDQHRHVRYK